MARILRRRVAQMPKVASSRRNLASEINQYLKLGMTAQQIIEKMIPDDPSITPEMMDPIFDLMAKAQPKPLAQRAAGAQQLAGSMLGQAPAIPVGQSPSEVVTSPSQVVAASPASSPRAAAPLKPEQLPPRATGQRLAAIQQTSPVSDLIDQAARIAATNADFTEIDEFKDLRDEIAIIFNDEFDSQNMYGDADVAIAETVQKLRDESVALPPPEPVPEPKATAKATAKAKVSQSIQEAQIADNAEQLKSSFRQMYNAIKEGSGMYDFADNVQRAVPLFLRAAQASKASGDDVRLLQTIIRKSVREAELADKQAGRTFRGAENQKNREARAAAIERRAVLKEKYRVAKLGGDKELEKFKQKNRVDTEKLRQRNRRAIEAYKQENRDKNRAAKALMGILTKKPSKTQAEKSFITEMKQKDKAVENYNDAMTKLQALLAMESTQEVFLLAESDLNDEHRQIREDVDAQIAIVEARRAAHSAMLQRLAGLAGQDTELLKVIPDELPAFEMPVWVPKDTPEQPEPADAQNAGGDADPAGDAATLIRNFNRE